MEAESCQRWKRSGWCPCKINMILLKLLIFKISVQ